MVGRFTSVDPIKSGLNWYSYCDNNPLNRIDPTGEEWYHWALGALIVAGCAAAVVLTAGGVLAGATAVGMVASGVAATTTASTVASGAFIGSSMMFGGCALSAAFSSDTPQEFAEQGNWGTVAATAGGAAVGALIGYVTDRSSKAHNDVTNTSSNATVEVVDETVSTLEVPEYVKNSRTFISWIRNFEKNSTFLKQDQVKQLIDMAKSYDVKIDYHIGGHPNTPWENISHLHFGNARIHIATADEMIDWVSQYLNSLM